MITPQATATRPVEKRIAWLHERVAMHRYICKKGKRTLAATQWHCSALGWSLREYRQALAEKQAQASREVINRLNRGLAGSPMAGLGAIFERYGRQWGVSPFFMAAAAATESSLGRAACGYQGHNAWGLANCSGIWGVPRFMTWADAISYYARFLKQHWPTARTPYDFSGYAKCGSCWGRKTAEWMNKLFHVGPSVIYASTPL